MVADEVDGGRRRGSRGRAGRRSLRPRAHALELRAVEETQILGVGAAVSLPVGHRRFIIVARLPRGCATDRVMSKTAIVVGAGHNGLVAAVMLAEARPQGARARGEAGDRRRGAHRAAVHEGAGARRRRRARTCSASCRPSSCSELGVDIPLMRRDPHYFLPDDRRALPALRLATTRAMKRQFIEFFSEADWTRQRGACNDEIGADPRRHRARRGSRSRSRSRTPPRRYVRPALRQAFVDLCRKPVGEYLDRFGFKSDLVQARCTPSTDGFSGLLRLVGHARHRDELPRPQHVPPARHATARG